MAKMSTKLLSFLLAVVMLVSMVPVVAFANGEGAPTLNGVVPTADMEIHNASVSGNTYFYEVDYKNNNFEFTLDYAEGVTAAVKTNLNVEIPAEGEGVYSLPLRQFSQYTYYVELSAPAADPEAAPLTATYILKITRLYNDEAEISAINGTGFTAVKSGESWTLEMDNNATSVAFIPEFSIGATYKIANDLGQNVVADKNGVYTFTKNTVLYVTVTAQDGVNVSEWTINIIVDKGNADCAIYGVDDATDTGAGYLANTSNEKFLVNVTVANGATYKLYKDSACTEEITNKELTLIETTTVVYIVVTASDGVTESEPVALTINTTNVADDVDEPVGELPYGGYPELQLRGGAVSEMFFGRPAITVSLEPGTTVYDLEAKVFGCDLTIYGDPMYLSLVRNNTQIKLDAGSSLLYAVLNKNGDETEVLISIVAPKFVTYNDELAVWAKESIELLADSGLGLIVGDAAGNFNGAKALSRYEMAALMVRLTGINKDHFKNFSHPFVDTIDPWAENYVKAAYKTGMITGIQAGEAYEFQGKKSTSRNQFFRVMMELEVGDVDVYYAENKAEIDAYVKAQGFSDADAVADWAKAGTYTAIALGYVQGSNGSINPTGVVTRNQAASMLVDILGLRSIIL